MQETWVQPLDREDSLEKGMKPTPVLNMPTNSLTVLPSKGEAHFPPFEGEREWGT